MAACGGDVDVGGLAGTRCWRWSCRSALTPKGTYVQDPSNPPLGSFFTVLISVIWGTSIHCVYAMPQCGLENKP